MAFSRLIHLEKVHQTIAPANKVRVIDIDVSILYLNETRDHVHRRVQTLIEYLLHDITNLGLQPIVLLQLRYLNADDQVAQLLIHLFGTVKRGLQKPYHLRLHQDVEGALRHEKTRAERARILDRALNVTVGKVLEWVNIIDHRRVDLVENVVYPRAALALLGDIVHKPTFNHLRVAVQKQVNDVQYHWTLVFT